MKNRFTSALLICLGFCLQPGLSFCGDNAYRVALVRSSSNAEYLETCESFRLALDDSDPQTVVDNYLLPGRGENGDFWSRVRASGPDLIVTVGTPATYSALRDSSGIPLVYCMVLDDPAVAVPAGRTVFGLTLRVPFAVQLESIRAALPTVRRVGYLRTAGNPDEVRELIELGDRLGIRLLPALVEDKKDVPGVLREVVDRIDLLWIPPDKNIYRQDVLNFVLQESFSKRVPVFAVSRQLAVAGAPLAVGCDYREIGRSTARLALDYLARGEIPEGGGGCSPVVLFINKPVAAGLGLHIPGNIINTATMVGNEDRE